MTLFIKTSDGRVLDAAHQTFGCAPAIAAGSVLTERMIGRSLTECEQMDESRLEEMLGDLPEHKGF